MPELPEVETVRRGLEPVLVHRTILRAEARRQDLRWPLPERFSARLTGRSIASLGRRGKVLLAALDDGETLIVHLGMSGRILLAANGEVSRPGRFATVAAGDAAPGASPHDHVILTIGNARTQPPVTAVLRDPRRFGAMDLIPSDRLHSHRLLAKLGPEPLGDGFTEETLRTAFCDRRATVKGLLLDQRIVAGIGNIYANEALHRAGIAPARAAGRIAARRLGLLVDSLKEVLKEAIAAGGSSLRDFRSANGDLGYFQHEFDVYGRDGQPCRRPGCVGRVRSRRIAGRSAFWCPFCQR